MRSLSAPLSRCRRRSATPGALWRWLAALWLGLPALVWGAPTVLEDIAFASLPGGSFEVKLSFSGSPPNPNGYVIESPPRMVFDFQNTRTGLPQKKYALSFDLAKSAVVVSSEDRTRLIINLNETAGYDLSTQGNDPRIIQFSLRVRF